MAGKDIHKLSEEVQSLITIVFFIVMIVASIAVIIPILTLDEQLPENS